MFATNVLRMLCGAVAVFVLCQAIAHMRYLMAVTTAMSGLMASLAPRLKDAVQQSVRRCMIERVAWLGWKKSPQSQQDAETGGGSTATHASRSTSRSSYACCRRGQTSSCHACVLHWLRALAAAQPARRRRQRHICGDNASGHIASASRSTEAHVRGVLLPAQAYPSHARGGWPGDDASSYSSARALVCVGVCVCVFVCL
jgi:hypothetical protein